MSAGQIELEAMLTRGELELCPPDVDGASALIGKARTHLETAALLMDSDAEIAMDALHAANRKSLDAVLLARGLRATKHGGHIASGEGVKWTLGGGSLGLIKVYGVVRRARHEGDYQNAIVDVHRDDVADNIDDSRALVEACAALVSAVPVFVPERR